MPQPFHNAVMTNGGAQLLTRAQAGELSIEFTRIVVGCGVYTNGEKAMLSLQARAGLKEPKNSYPLSSVAAINQHSVEMTVLITNRDPATNGALINEGYYINEMGLYAKEKGGGDDTEVLYSIAVTSGEFGDFMPPYNGYSAAEIEQRYRATINNSEEITVQMQGAVALATDMQLLKNYVSSMISAIPITIPATGWVKSSGASAGAYPLYIDIPIPGVTADMAPCTAVLPAYLDTAAACGLAPTAQTLDGALRMYTVVAPGSDMRASLTLFTASGTVPPGGAASGGDGTGGGSVSEVAQVAAQIVMKNMKGIPADDARALVGK